MRRNERRLLRLLFSRQRAQGANEEHEFPIVIGGLVRTAPCRHSRELHTVDDDVVDLAVGEILSLGRPQVGHARIEIATERSYSAAVNSVTVGTSRQENLSPSLEIFRRGIQGIGLASGRTGNGKISHASRKRTFQPRGFIGGAKAAPDQKYRAKKGGHTDNDEQDKWRFPSSHLRPSVWVSGKLGLFYRNSPELTAWLVVAGFFTSRCFKPVLRKCDEPVSSCGPQRNAALGKEILLWLHCRMQT